MRLVQHGRQAQQPGVQLRLLRVNVATEQKHLEDLIRSDLFSVRQVSPSPVHAAGRVEHRGSRPVLAQRRAINLQVAEELVEQSQRWVVRVVWQTGKQPVLGNTADRVVDLADATESLPGCPRIASNFRARIALGVDVRRCGSLCCVLAAERASARRESAKGHRWSLGGKSIAHIRSDAIFCSSSASLSGAVMWGE